MRLTVKITFAVLLGVALVFSAYSYFSIQREREQLKKNLSREARHIGESLRYIVSELWQQRGEQVAIAFLSKANQDYKSALVRWVWIAEETEEKYHPRIPLDQLGDLLNEETVALLAGTPEGKDFLLTYLPLLIEDGRVGAIEISESMDEMHDYVQESLQRSAIVVGASIISGLLFMGALGSIWIDRPMRKLRAQAERIGTGDFSPGDDLPGSGEIAELSATIGRMRNQLAAAQAAEKTANSEKIAALEKLRHTERLATLGQLSAGIAHELGTPLNVISGRAKLIRSEGMEAADISRSATIIGEQADRMTGIMQQLLSFARRGKAQKQFIDLNTMARSIQPLLLPIAREQQVELVITTTNEPLSVYVDPGQIQQVLLNLTLNGIQSMTGVGQVRLTSERVSYVEPPDKLNDSSVNWLCLTVEDQGGGIKEEMLGQIFDPFFTTKDIGKGTGLGLSIAYGIVEEHGGWIDVSSVLGEGSRFTIYLPEARLEKQPHEG